MKPFESWFAAESGKGESRQATADRERGALAQAPQEQGAPLASELDFIFYMVL